MLVDLHAHYPVHLVAGEPRTGELLLSTRRPSLRDRIRALVLRLASHVANYQGAQGGPAVTLAGLRGSNVRVVLSVLYAPFDEMDLDRAYGDAPQPGYFPDLLQQIDVVEASVQGCDDVVVAHDPAELEAAVAAGKLVLVHAVEGGFHLGGTPEVVAANVATLAQRGVAYVTLAHLFWRQIATNAPALPFLPDWGYDTLFPQPGYGLTALGQAAVVAMVQNGILLDITHMSAASANDTLTLLDRLDPEGTVPVIASHGACQFGQLRYNLPDDLVRRIAARHGVVGLIACTHYMSSGLKEPRNFQQSVDIICRHIDRLRAVTGSHETAAFGSDQDGFIKPTLPGLETPAGLGAIEQELARRYDADTARLICGDNARRVLRAWRRVGSASPPSVAGVSATTTPAPVVPAGGGA